MTQRTEIESDVSYNQSEIQIEDEPVSRMLYYINDISENIKEYIDDIRAMVQQAYLEGKQEIEAHKIKQQFKSLPLKDIDDIISISENLMSILPREKINFKGKFQQIIYKIAVIKEIFDNVQKYLQNKISLSNAVKFIANVSMRVIKNMNITNFDSEKYLDIYESTAMVDR